MLDMGFQEEMTRVFESVKSGAEGRADRADVQTLLFSATLPGWVGCLSFVLCVNEVLG